jgi:DNA modification methylase
MEIKLMKINEVIPYDNNPRNIVLDFFGGSGSTLITCEQTKRRCFMMELDEKYCSVIIERWEKLTNQQAIKIGSL